MERKIIVSVTLICFVICVQGCTSKYTVLPEHMEEKPVYSKVTVETTDGEVYDFDVIFVQDGCLEGYVDDSILVNIELEDIESVNILSFDATKTAWYTGVTAGVVGIVAAILVMAALAYAMAKYH